MTIHTYHLLQQYLLITKCIISTLIAIGLCGVLIYAFKDAKNTSR